MSRPVAVGALLLLGAWFACAKSDPNLGVPASDASFLSPADRAVVDDPNFMPMNGDAMPTPPSKVLLPTDGAGQGGSGGGGVTGSDAAYMPPAGDARTDSSDARDGSGGGVFGAPCSAAFPCDQGLLCFMNVCHTKCDLTAPKCPVTAPTCTDPHSPIASNDGFCQ